MTEWVHHPTHSIAEALIRHRKDLHCSSSDSSSLHCIGIYDEQVDPD